MLKSNLVSLFGLTVLGFGLASCARDGHQEHTSGAAYGSAAKPPRIVRQLGLVDLAAWDKSEDKNLTLNDTLDLSASRPRGVEITAHCGEGAKEIVHHSWFENRDTIPFFQTLPDQILTRDLTKSPETCRYVITLSDDLGRRHGYLMTTVIHEDDKSPVRLDANGLKIPEHLDVNKLPGLRLRFDNGGGANAQARLICAEATFPALPFHQVLDLGSFDMSEFPKGGGNNAITIPINPVQSCRFSIEERVERGKAAESSRRLAVSKLVSMRFNHGVWWLEPVPVADQTGRLGEDNSFTIAEYRIHNLDDKTHQLRMPKPAFDAQIHIFYPNPKYATREEKPSVGLEYFDITGPQRWTSQILTLPPSFPLRVRVKYYGVGAIECPYSALRVTALQNVYVEDLGTQREVRASLEIPIPKPGLLVVNPDVPAEFSQQPELVPRATTFLEFSTGQCSIL